MNISFFKIFGFIGFLGAWATESLAPDSDGIVRITIPELAKLGKGVCDVFGWKAEFIVPESIGEITEMLP